MYFIPDYLSHYMKPKTSKSTLIPSFSSFQTSVHLPLGFIVSLLNSTIAGSHHATMPFCKDIPLSQCERFKLKHTGWLVGPRFSPPPLPVHTTLWQNTTYMTLSGGLAPESFFWMFPLSSHWKWNLTPPWGRSFSCMPFKRICSPFLSFTLWVMFNICNKVM